MLSVVYGRRPPRRPARGLEEQRATRRPGPFRLSDLGAWAARGSKDAAAAPPTARAGAKVPVVVRAAATLTSPDDLTGAGKRAIDWPRLLTAGYPDPRGRQVGVLEELRHVAAPLVRSAFAEDAARRDRVVLVTSPGRGEGRTFVTVSLALGLARERPVLLVDGDLERTGAAGPFDLGGAKGLSDALADPALQPDRLIVRTELERVALLGAGEPRPDLLRLIASRRMFRLVHDLLAEDPSRLILIDGPPLSRPAAQALALFAGQVVLVVAAGTTSRGMVETALERLGERPNVSLLLNRARGARSRLPGAAEPDCPGPGRPR